MDRIAHAENNGGNYANIVREIVEGVAVQFPEDGEIETQRVYDEARGHFELLRVGWRNKRRIHGIALHVDVQNGKVWIQHDGTEDGIADALVAAGIPKEHIVLAFHPPYKRPYTGFATT